VAQVFLAERETDMNLFYLEAKKIHFSLRSEAEKNEARLSQKVKQTLAKQEKRKQKLF